MTVVVNQIAKRSSNWLSQASTTLLVPIILALFSRNTYPKQQHVLDNQSKNKDEEEKEEEDVPPLIKGQTNVLLINILDLRILTATRKMK